MALKKGKVDGDYQVMGIDEEGYSKVNGQVHQSLSLLNLDDLDDLESKLTSASSKKHKMVAGSLSTVLS